MGETRRDLVLDAADVAAGVDDDESQPVGAGLDEQRESEPMPSPGCVRRMSFRPARTIRPPSSTSANATDSGAATDEGR